MPRRLITSEIFSNERFGDLPMGARLLFVGMITNADDEGRIKASPRFLKHRVFPYDDEVSTQDVKVWRDQCHELGLVSIYSPNGQDYISLVGWKEHQAIRKDRFKPSRLPQPPDNQPTTT